MGKLLHLIDCVYLTLHNLYFELCVLVEQINVKHFFCYIVCNGNETRFVLNKWN